MDKSKRLHQLLQAIVQEYISTAHPVSSKVLAEKYDINYSSATIRNDMAILEDDGYITQPHTSAGRIPTEKGYQFYIKHFLNERELNRKQKQSLEQVAHDRNADNQQKMRQLAKAVAELTDEVVLLSHYDNGFYYTGISHMFRKPEFAELEEMVSLGEIFDQMDELMQSVSQTMDQQLQIMIGQENPISEQCSLIVSECAPDQDRQNMIGILGPMRMDYGTNIAILQYVESLMDDLNERS